MYFDEPTDESNADELRVEVASRLGIDSAFLSKTRIIRSPFHVKEAPVGCDLLFDPSDPPALDQYLVGKHLEVVLTVEGSAFEIAEYQDLGGGMVPTTPVRRRSKSSISVESSELNIQGMLGFELSQELRCSLSQEELGAIVAATIRHLSTTRRRRYRRCQYCKVMTPPEAQFQRDCCEECATKTLPGKEWSVVF
jgi:hypothetical protein